VSASADHRHCKVCGRATPPDEEVCGRTCQEERDRRLRTRRSYTLLLYGSIALILLVFVSHFFV
jgi:predicted nucleic acid-binding Zn ribbon protein